MCRFAAYLGHPLLLSQLITEPVHSLIHQSYRSLERPEPLNGDGFGVAWFVPEISPTPALFKEITPAWNNENLREIARVTTSRCILAHVRAASPESSVHRLNCHPFAAGSVALMHNGFLAGFSHWRRALLAELSDEAFGLIRGSTDSEHAFALFWDNWRRRTETDPMEAMFLALQATIARLEQLKLAAGLHDCSYFNFCVADGERLVATRFSSDHQSPASLHYTTGRELRCREGVHLAEPADKDPNFVIVASEETAPGFCWNVVPVNHAVLAWQAGVARVRPLNVADLHHSTVPQKSLSC